MKLILLLIIGYLFYMMIQLVLTLYRSFRAQSTQSTMRDNFNRDSTDDNNVPEKDISNIARIIEEKPLDKDDPK